MSHSPHIKLATTQATRDTGWSVFASLALHGIVVVALARGVFVRDMSVAVTSGSASIESVISTTTAVGELRLESTDVGFTPPSPPRPVDLQRVAGNRTPAAANVSPVIPATRLVPMQRPLVPESVELQELLDVVFAERSAQFEPPLNPAVLQDKAVPASDSLSASATSPARSISSPSKPAVNQPDSQQSGAPGKTAESAASNGARVDVLPKKLPTNAAPDYPAQALAARQEGRVVLRVLVLEDGTVGELSVHRTSGNAALDEAAMSAVQHWQFEPARDGGRAVRHEIGVPISFDIAQPARAAR